MRYKLGEVSSYPEYFRWYWRPDGLSKDPKAVVEFWCQHRMMLYDSDSAGDETKVFAVGDSDGVFNFFKVEHTWSWCNYGQEDSHLENTFEITELSETEARKITPAKNWPVV